MPITIRLSVLLAVWLATAGIPQPGFGQGLPAGIANGTPLLNLDGPQDVRGVLSNADISAYLQIFDLQERGRLTDAAFLIHEIENPILMGYVQAQKYLHPTAHRSSFTELRDWLQLYRDHPQADRIHRLASRRRPANAAAPATPTHFAPPPVYEFEPVARTVVTGRVGLTRDQIRAVASLRSQIATRVANGWPTGARELLRANQAAGWMSAHERFGAAAQIARGYYRAGIYEEALAEADSIWIGDAGGGASLAHWWGGLAAWQLGRMEPAQRHFAALAGSSDASQWVLSAASYWAARAYLAGRQPDQVNYWLNVGASYPYTFYGMLAQRALGYPLDYNWSQPDLRPDLLAQTISAPNGQRAVALLQLGLTGEAQMELANLAGNERDLATTIMALASRADLPHLAKRLSGADRTIVPPPAAAYPLPPWTPDGGFAIDRALIYGFVRQESSFDQAATSRAGARGLMQLMPSTASFVAGDRSLRSSGSDRLYDPGYNLHLGQSYIARLLRHEAIDNDLFKLAIAYNAGPGNLQNWFADAGEPDDSLLFIETLPSRETRIFVERVMANFWIYRNRLGQPTPSLSTAAAGGWPSLVRQDNFSRPVAARSDVEIRNAAQ